MLEKVNVILKKIVFNNIQEQCGVCLKFSLKGSPAQHDCVRLKIHDADILLKPCSDIRMSL